MKTLNELYKLLLIEFETNKHGGICNAITDLYCCGKITIQDHHILFKHFRSERPRLFKNTLFVFKNNYRYDDAYWWPCGDKKPRIKFIKHLINKTK